MIIKIIFSLLILSITYFASSAQAKYGNEWIDASKSYFKLKIAQNGIYKVTFEELVGAGFGENNIIGSSLKLYNFGEERAIYVSDNDFGPGDYFEFYGEKNTIGLDSLLYNDWSKDLFNPEYSLVTDTNAYFLTLSPESSNLRYTLVNPDFNNNTLTPFPFYLHDEKIVFSGSYFKNVDGDIRYSHFEPSEGFGDALQQISTTLLNTSQLVDSGPNPVLRFRSGQNNHLSKLEISWNNQIKETPFINPKLTSQFFYELEKSEVKGSNNLVLKNINSANDRHRLAYVSLVYPRAFDFGGTTEYNFLLPSSATKRYLQISSFKTENSAVYLYDIKNQIRYTTKVNDGNVQAIVNPVNADTKYLLINSETGVKKVNSISKFIPKKFANTGQEYVIISNYKLYGSGQNYVKEYADYRSSEAGGNYQTEIIEIQDIYDHFAYGIDRHFMGIKHLAGFMKNNWQEMKFVLILGKGIEYPYMRTNNDVINYENLVFFIPTFGYVGSDNMLFSERNFPDPYFAVGRVAARTPEDIKNYLDKVKQYDQARLAPQTIEDKYWMKRVLNLSGGKTEQEQNAIKSGLQNMEQIISDVNFGGDVYSFYKNSSGSVQFSTNEAINNLFNTGVSFVNFFGHSSAGLWDFTIENPKNYINAGRYPFINSFGCYAGNLHSTSKGISETFVLEKERGSIAFFASTGTAFISSLSSYGARFYNTLLNDLKFKTFGETVTQLAKINRNAQFAELALYSQLTYHGDPAVKPYQEEFQDYTFDPKSVKTEPNNILASMEKFNIDLDIVNLGAYRKDSFDIIFYHELANGKRVDTIMIRSAGISNTKRFNIPLKNYGNLSIGKNKLYGNIDPINSIKEYPDPNAENNNELMSNAVKGYEFFVSDNFAKIIYPPDFGIINTNEHFVLKASTSSVPVAKGKYIFQLDTTAYFNSPIIENGTVDSEGGLLSFKPTQNLVKDRVYYCRVSPDSTQDAGYNWSVSSFTYLPEEQEGWNQSHFFQFTQNEFMDFTISEKTNRRFQFAENYHNAIFKNKYWDINERPGYTFDNVLFGSVAPWTYLSSGLGFVIYKQKTGIFIRNAAGGEYGSLNPTGASIAVYPFKTDTPANRKNVVNFIKDVLVEGDYVTVFSIVSDGNADMNINEWENDSNIYGNNIFNALESLGGVKSALLKSRGTVPYILQTIVGERALNEEIAETKGEIIESKTIVYNYLPSGNQNSTIIGPASNWKKLSFKIDEKSGLRKNAYVGIAGINLQGDEIQLDSLITNSKPLDIDPNIYKYLKLSNLNYDSVGYNSPQLNYWRVGFEALPDAAISFVKAEPNPSNNEVSQGESVKIFYEVANVNFIHMDSILVKFTYVDNENQSVVKYKKLGKLHAGQKISDLIEFSITTGNTNQVRFIIEINPDSSQPELHHFNNVLTKQLNVAKDNFNPLLQVYFDGIHIMDGDIVSPNPEILVILEDDNLYLPVTDPNLFEIKLDTGRNQVLEIPMNSPEIKFTPAGASEKKAKIQYYPILKEGEYKLIVQAADASGNKSGINPKSINFRVIEKQSISNLINYPNPFSTSTQFIFTLTGAEVPDIMSISVMTLTGKVVREITKEELGPLHIGVNRTEYKWDGTDEYGSKLANGVYLYKMNTRKKNGESYNHFGNTKTDIYFKDGFGKLVILR